MRFKNTVLLGVGCVVVAGLAYRYLAQDLSHSASSVAGTAQASSAPGSLFSNPFSTGSSGVKMPDVEQPAVAAGDLSYNTRAFKGALLPDRLTAMSMRRNGQTFDPQQVADALKSDLAWAPDPSLADKLSLTDAERKDGREFVRINPLKIEALMKGDEINLPIKQIKADAPVRMVVDEVEQRIGGNVTWHGHLKDFGKENQVSLTRGETLIVGGVSMPDKNYVVQIDGDVGWIVNASTIFKGKHDAIKPDLNGGASTNNGDPHTQ